MVQVVGCAEPGSCSDAEELTAVADAPALDRVIETPAKGLRRPLCTVRGEGGDMGDQDWDDDTDYQRAVGRAWFTVAIASCCSLLVVSLAAVAVFGVGVFMALVEALSG